MRSFRSKPKGWQRDNYRHYLAAKYGKAHRYDAQMELVSPYSPASPGFSASRKMTFAVPVPQPGVDVPREHPIENIPQYGGDEVVRSPLPVEMEEIFPGWSEAYKKDARGKPIQGVLSDQQLAQLEDWQNHPGKQMPNTELIARIAEWHKLTDEMPEGYEGEVKFDREDLDREMRLAWEKGNAQVGDYTEPKEDVWYSVGPDREQQETEFLKHLDELGEKYPAPAELPDVKFVKEPVGKPVLKIKLVDERPKTVFKLRY